MKAILFGVIAILLLQENSSTNATSTVIGTTSKLPGVTTSAGPVIDTTSKLPGVTTSAGPVIDTTSKLPGVTTSAGPVIGTASKLAGVTTSAGPVIGTTSKLPGVTTSAGPVIGTTSKPDIITSTGPVIGATSKPTPGVTASPTATPSVTSSILVGSTSTTNTTIIGATSTSPGVIAISTATMSVTSSISVRGTNNTNTIVNRTTSKPTPGLIVSSIATLSVTSSILVGSTNTTSTTVSGVTSTSPGVIASPTAIVSVTSPKPSGTSNTSKLSVSMTTAKPSVNMSTPKPSIIVTPLNPSVTVTTLKQTVTVTTLKPSVTVTTQKPTNTPTPRITTTAFVENITYYEYEISMTLTNIKKETTDENEQQDLEILSVLFNECSNELTKEKSIYYITCQKYLRKQICGIDAFKDDECKLTLTELECGSLKIKYNLVLGVQGPDPDGISKGKATNVIKDEIKGGKLGAFAVSNTSFNYTFENETTKPDPTEEPAQAEPNVYVIVTLEYTWREFCGLVEEHLKERIAERSYNVEGEKLKPTDIYIVNNERNCINPDDKNEGIDVWIAAIGKDADKTTIQIGEDLKDLLDTRQTRKLGNLFEGKITDVEFGGKNAPHLSKTSDNEKIWLGVGITLAIFLVLLVIYLCCIRKNQDKNDEERGPNYFTMDNLDGSKKESTVLLNEGFDDQETSHTPLSERVSTFKDAQEPEKPSKKTEMVYVNAEKEPKEDSKQKAPLGEGEDTDDELGLTVADVAIEPDKGEKSGATPPGTLPIIPPDPVHMAIQDRGKLTESKDKQYEDLDQTKANPTIYPNNTTDKNRTANIVPKPETRVKLSGENDYINANFVKDHHGADSFIATQHPLSNTMRDFWSMIWQQDVSVVVMVNDGEKDLENFHNYWMNQKNSLTIYGNMQVKTDNMENMGAFDITTFVLKNSQESDASKVVRHFRFTSWPNKGVPDVKEFATFIKSVDKSRALASSKSPIVVHCKDGQGYTGVALAAEIGLRVFNESDKKSTVDVFDCVNKMRADRNGIVSSKDLYQYIFEVLKNIIDSTSASDSKL